MPPFRTFGDLYYTYQLSLDVKVDEGYAIGTEPHPRFYTDPTDTTPIAVPALIRRWWPMIYFLVFKSPAEGAVHIFRPGEPFAQILIVPEEAAFELDPMSDEEAAERKLQSRRTIGAAARFRPRRSGRRRPIPFSTERIAIFSARPMKGRSGGVERMKGRARGLRLAVARGSRASVVVVVIMLMVVVVMASLRPIAMMVMMVMVVVLRQFYRLPFGRAGEASLIFRPKDIGRIRNGVIGQATSVGFLGQLAP